MNEIWKNIKTLESSEGNVSKYVFTKDNAVAESVLYKYPRYKDHTVICCSTQSGCPVGCRFCGAGDYFVRNFNAEEIVSQPMHLLEEVYRVERTNPRDIDKLQIMFMSMGEPMLNQKHLIPALEILHAQYPNASLLISSSGPRVSYEPFFKASEAIDTIGLQFSIHETTDEARDLLIPFKAKLTLKEISEQGRIWHERTGRQPFFNYCVHDKNGTQEDVDRLKELFDPTFWQATISVICERDESIAVAHARQLELTGQFMSKMSAAGFSTRRFDPAGQDDIGGGCGQLHYVQAWFKENPTLSKFSVGAQLPILHAPTI